MLHSREHYIDGDWKKSDTSRALRVVSPSSEALIGEVPDGTSADVASAVDAADRALRDGVWSDWSVDQRADLLLHLADRVLAMEDEFVKVTTQEMGQSLAMSRGGVQLSAQWCRFYAGVMAKELAEYHVEDASARSLVFRDPVGVVAALTPYNGGIAGAMQKIVPALALGCTTVWKPAHQTPLSSLLFAEMLQSLDLPPGVVNIVNGGRDTGAALVANPRVNKIAFTGSTAVGQAIMRQAASHMQRLTLELGGKSAALLLDDVDAASAAQALARMALAITGQVCHCQSRILVPRSRYREIADALVDAVQALKFGDPCDPENFSGPLVSEEQRERVESYIEIGRSEGASLLCGGARPAGLHRGWFLEATIFGDATNAMRIAREEIFGPVLALIPYDTENEAITMANDSLFGLSGSVWTADPDRGLKVARRIRTGQVSINGERHPVGAPFGGVGMSGLGRQRCAETLHEYSELRSIAVGRPS